MLLENIKRLCDDRHTSIAAVERATGLGNGVIARWDKSVPRLDSVSVVADYFGVTINDLLTPSVSKDTA